MATELDNQLVKYLTDAHAMEEQSAELLEKAADIAGDEEIARIYRAHLMQTQEHERYIAERLQAHGAGPSTARDLASKAAAAGIGLVAQAAPDTPARLAVTAFAFEHLEVAAYRMLLDLAERAGDAETASVIERILEQEEAATELVAGTFSRALEVTLGEPAESPVTPVTPLGKPSERPAERGPESGSRSEGEGAPDEAHREPAAIKRHPEPGHPVPGEGPSLPG